MCEQEKNGFQCGSFSLMGTQGNGHELELSHQFAGRKMGLQGDTDVSLPADHTDELMLWVFAVSDSGSPHSTGWS